MWSGGARRSSLTTRIEGRWMGSGVALPIQAKKKLWFSKQAITLDTTILVKQLGVRYN